MENSTPYELIIKRSNIIHLNIENQKKIIESAIEHFKKSIDHCSEVRKITINPINLF